MKNRILMLAASIFLITTRVFAQDNFLSKDYQIFGRKDPISPGALFSALGTSPILINPANIALVTDNRINFGGGYSDLGTGTFISWMAPNLSISSASQKVELADFPYYDHEKRRLYFTFGISSKDLGWSGSDHALAVGMTVKRQHDKLTGVNDSTIAGGNGVGIDFGLALVWRPITFEFAVLDLNQPDLSESDLSYNRSFVAGARLLTASGLLLSLQGVGGNSYAGSDFGLHFSAEQKFFGNRLIPRLQLTSFFVKSEATMQNISASISYRLDPANRILVFVKDLEFSYALSFLTLPKNVGTHLLVMTKYF